MSKETFRPLHILQDMEKQGKLSTCQHLISQKLQNRLKLILHQIQSEAGSENRITSNLSDKGNAQVSVYLVVCPDGDFELRQDSLHLQVPLCCINSRLQNLVWFGGRFCLLSENKHDLFHHEVLQNSDLQT